MKKLIILGAAVAFAFTGAAQAGSGTKSTTTTSAASSASKNTSTGAAAGLSLDKTQVQLIQITLSDLGYTPGPIDGDWGKASKAALKAYQSDREFKATGTLTTSQACSLMRTGIANHGSAGKLPGFCESN